MITVITIFLLATDLSCAFKLCILLTHFHIYNFVQFCILAPSRYQHDADSSIFYGPYGSILNYIFLQKFDIFSFRFLSYFLCHVNNFVSIVAPPKFWFKATSIFFVTWIFELLLTLVDDTGFFFVEYFLFTEILRQVTPQCLI